MRCTICNFSFVYSSVLFECHLKYDVYQVQCHSILLIFYMVEKLKCIVKKGILKILPDKMLLEKLSELIIKLS